MLGHEARDTGAKVSDQDDSEPVWVQCLEPFKATLWFEGSEQSDQDASFWGQSCALFVRIDRTEEVGVDAVGHHDTVETEPSIDALRLVGAYCEAGVGSFERQAQVWEFAWSKGIAVEVVAPNTDGDRKS